LKVVLNTKCLETRFGEPRRLVLEEIETLAPGPLRDVESFIRAAPALQSDKNGLSGRDIN
jgi:hypothetical protein